ncbi:DUF262 domain-containing protein [Glaciimonas sp. PCH181]|uniref:GmrSD restriction endonuclease domain-containing protein n=1 Tax=Glaciimonas sp. PCH181 TaxID=2133943 RepID=UPI000D3CB08B|nr:DUF262 domain-containing protein [Glaciimonas sp. PCH181]PUA19156.1 DUF262 domain-containing protein [Glaciimonas sp. PCH181]
MSDMNNATTFVGLLDQCSRIEVPQIQRDYAQGRETEAEVRLDFLNALHTALDPESTHRATPMNLDFIYGSMEEDADGSYFLPLDGQQRLTTLLLLHWYLAWRDGELSDFQERLWNGRHSRFSYKVRPSSAEFFDDLVRFVPEVLPDGVLSIKKLLEDQHWFFLSWRLDPTIQSALTMLDAIHGRFGTSTGLYVRLLDDKQPAITFQLLQLENFGLSDDLYIKMNARGKPLTSFETFKARFEEDLKTLFPTERRQIGEKSWSVRDFFAQRMDTQWTDFFWSYRSRGSKVFDAEVMNLLWTVAQLSLDPESKTFAKDTSALQNKQVTVNYSTLRDGGWLTRDFAIQLMALLDAWSTGEGKLTRQMGRKRYFDEEALFQKAIKSPAALNYAELLQFNAFVLYLTQWPTAVTADELQEWMRVVSNLAVNTSYDHVDVFQRCMASLRKLLPESRQILVHFAEMDATRLGGFSPQQVQEEVLKAKLMLADSGWRNRIEQAEGHGYFEGQIEFLLDFSSLLEVMIGSSADAWSELEHKEKQAVFDDFFAKATLTFDKDGLTEPIGAARSLYLWQRALLVVGDYLMPIGSNQSFGTNNADNPDSWKRFLRGGKADAVGRRLHLKSLWERLDGAVPILPQLEHIIESAIDLVPWRDEIVKHSQVIDYCLERKIRKVNDNKVYLLKRLQMNGAHAELFSYALYQDKTTISLDEQLKPLEIVGYNTVSESSIEPQVRLSFVGAKFRVNFAIESCHAGLRIVVDRSTSPGITEVEVSLMSEMGFYEEQKNLVRPVGYGSIVQILRRLVSVLSKKSETEF